MHRREWRPGHRMDAPAKHPTGGQRCDDAGHGRTGATQEDQDGRGVQPHSRHPADGQDHHPVAYGRTGIGCRCLYRQAVLVQPAPGTDLQPADQPRAYPPVLLQIAGGQHEVDCLFQDGRAVPRETEPHHPRAYQRSGSGCQPDRRTHAPQPAHLIPQDPGNLRHDTQRSHPHHPPQTGCRTLVAKRYEDLRDSRGRRLPLAILFQYEFHQPVRCQSF